MARKFYINMQSDVEINNNIIVDGEEFNHIANVMRKKIGEQISVINGSGTDYICEITEINKKNLALKVVDKKVCENEIKNNVTIFQALVKGEKFELILQKITELGSNKLVPFCSEFCQVKANTTKLERLEKISIEALKQCGRAKKLEINSILNFNQTLEELKKYDKVIFAYENATDKLSSELFENCKKPLSVAIVVGSEGGFSEEEAKLLREMPNVSVVSMGKRILRAETATIALTSVVMFLLNEWEIN